MGYGLISKMIACKALWQSESTFPYAKDIAIDRIHGLLSLTMSSQDVNGTQ